MKPAAHPNVKPAPTVAQNRRRGNRHRLNISATLRLEEESATDIPVVVTELSVGGFGFRCPQLLRAHATYRISSFDTLIPQGTLAKIVSQRQLPGGDFEVGATTH
jgi:hypothetical protein